MTVLWNRWSVLGIATAGVFAIGAATWQRIQVDHMSPVRALLPQPVVSNGQVVLRVHGHRACTEAATYDDELFAFLMHDHLRRPFASRGLRLMLVYEPADSASQYSLVACGDHDMLAAIAATSGVRVSGLELAGGWRLVPERQVERMNEQTRVFLAAYNLPVRDKLEQLPRGAVSRYLQRFIRFKSATDPRIRRRLEPVPLALRSDEAQRLAADIITVADFFDLPLDMFLGIGAMENNYMDVRGDLQHTVWKRRPAPDDIVVERRKGRVRVVNDSAGVWQITRETLRHAHRLYRNDDRDYNALPARLLPPAVLDVRNVDPTVLTTYAGLLLRDLLDRFDGDAVLAAAAYNGGPGRPNLTYGLGVEQAALHARRALEQAAVLNGEAVMERQWLR